MEYQLQSGEEEQDVIHDEVPYFATEGSAGGDATQPDHREAVIVFWSYIKTKARMEHIICSTVVDVEEAPMELDMFTLEEFLPIQKKDCFCREPAESGGDPPSCLDYDRYGIPAQRSKSY